MTNVIINDILPLTQAVATSGQTVFSTNWTANYASDVVVYSRAANTAADDATQILTSNQFSVAFVGGSLTVQVTLVTGSTIGDIVTITRQTPADRENLYTNTNFTPSMLNNDFGILTLVDQQNQLVNQQVAPRYNYSELLNLPGDLILPYLPANSVWQKDPTNSFIQTVIPLTQGNVSSIPFIVQQANSLVPAAQSLAALSTGILKSTTSTGVLTISAPLTSLDALGITTNYLPYGTSSNVYGQASFTPYSQTLLALTDAGDWRTALGVGPAPPSTYLTIAGNLSDVASVSGAVSNLGLTIGTYTQAYNSNLQSISGLGTTSDRMLYTTGTATWAELSTTSYGRSLLASANAADAASTLAVLPLAGGTMTGALYLASDPTTGSQAATKAYVDAVTLNQQLACLCITTSDMPTWTYSNGTSGVGATLTAPSNGASTFDGITPVNTNRILVNFQTTNPAWQGAYTIVQGTVSTPTVLTRAIDYDTPAQIQAGDTFSVVEGTSYGASQWMMSQVSAITIGTTAITFSQVTGQGALLKANNLSDLPSASTARSNLGLVIGTNVQAYNANLQSISALGTAANKMIYTTGTATWAETATVAFGRTLLGISGVNSGVLVTDGSSVASISTTLPSGLAMGTPASLTLTNATGLPLSGIASLGTGVATALAVNVGSAGAFVTFNGALGTPSSGTLTHGTGLPVSTGISGLGTGVATALAAAVTGSNGIVLATSPTITTPMIAQINDANGNVSLALTSVSTAVNYLVTQNNIAGSAPVLYAAGSDTNITLSLLGKGTSGVRLMGFTDGSSAISGSVGELMSATATSVSLSSGTAKTVCSITLTGDWDVWGSIGFTANTGTTTSNIVCAINTTTNALPASAIAAGTSYSQLQTTFTTASYNQISTYPAAISVNSATVYYLVANANFAVSTMTAQGIIIARRRR